MDAEALLKRIRELEEGQAELKREVSELVRRAVFKQLLRSSPERRPAAGAGWQCSSSSSRRPPVGRPGAGLAARHHGMAMQALGQAVHILDLRGKVLYWNRCAEHLYGYSASEAIGHDVTELLVHPDDIVPATSIIGNIFTGKCWRGKFPVKNKSGQRFSIVTCGTPFHDDDGSMIGLICLSDDTRILQEIIGLPVSGCYYDPIS